MRSGERQVAKDLSGIRRDHLARYEWAISQLEKPSRVVDCACGVGYGAFMMASAGHTVLAIDNDAEAIAYGKKYYNHKNIIWWQTDASDLALNSEWDAVTCFETIEHLKDPLPMLVEFRRSAKRLFASVPNETEFPHEGKYLFHYRHYTNNESQDLLLKAGWEPYWLGGQRGTESLVAPDMKGRTLVFEARPMEKDSPWALADYAGNHTIDEARVNAFLAVETTGEKLPSPKHVAIVALGPSGDLFYPLSKCLGGTRAYCDEVWGINAVGGVLACDRVFHMDDMRVQEMRAEAKPGGNIAEMVRWLKTHQGPIYTSVVREGYPGAVAFPLEEVINAGLPGAFAYFNSTTAYAIAYAIHIGVERISLFGVDYTQPNVHHGERGRACCEYWLGIAAAKGILITVPDASTLLDACAPERERLYGYDMVDVCLLEGDDGRLTVTFEERLDPPTAADVEAAYDHKNVHTNRILAQAAQ